jgi:hypothetical protein
MCLCLVLHCVGYSTERDVCTTNGGKEERRIEEKEGRIQNPLFAFSSAPYVYMIVVRRRERNETLWPNIVPSDHSRFSRSFVTLFSSTFQDYSVEYEKNVWPFNATHTLNLNFRSPLNIARREIVFCLLRIEKMPKYRKNQKWQKLSSTASYFSGYRDECLAVCSLTLWAFTEQTRHWRTDNVWYKQIHYQNWSAVKWERNSHVNRIDTSNLRRSLWIIRQRLRWTTPPIKQSEWQRLNISKNEKRKRYLAAVEKKDVTVHTPETRHSRFGGKLLQVASF